MRKITSRHQEAKKKKRNQLTVGLILVFIMLFSVLGYGFGGGGSSSSNPNKITYNGYEFENQNGLWILNLGGFTFVFKYNPEQVEKSNSYVKKLNNYYQKPVYISSENRETETEIYLNLRQVALRAQPACLEFEECSDENFAIKTCADNFIIIKEANTSEIYQEENCVFIQGPQENLTMLADEFLFKILDIE